MSVDTYHWDDKSISDALQRVSDHGIRVDGSRLHQLAGEPPAKVIIDIFELGLPPAVLGAALREGIKILIERLRRTKNNDAAIGSASTKIDLVVRHDESRAHFECDESTPDTRFITDIARLMHEFRPTVPPPSEKSENDGQDGSHPDE